MAEQNLRRSIISKRTHVRQQKHEATFPAGLHIPPRTIDSIVIGLSYAGIAYFVYSNMRKISPWELVGVGLGSLTFSYGLFDLGKRNGMIKGASFALSKADEQDTKGGWGDDDDWEDEFKGREYEDLKVADKIAWLRKEEKWIKEVQEEEQLKCGQAYIAKEESYVEYEKRGGYGGENWKRYVLMLLELEVQSRNCC
jgi:hypothetical protein